MKKKAPKINFHLLLIVALSLIPALAILSNPLLFHSHDGPAHLAKIAGYHQALTGGQFPVRWASGFNYGYGSPVFVFTYQWPYLLSAAFLIAGFGLVSAFKLGLLLGLLSAGVFMFLAAKQFFKDSRKALLSALFYQFYTYHLALIAIRGAYGELWSYAFAPLPLLGLAHIYRHHNRKGILITALGSGLLLISHNTVSLSYYIAAALFTLLVLDGLKQKSLAAFGLLLGLGLAAFYWLPVLYEKQFTYGDLFVKDMYLNHFPKLWQFFIPNPANRSFGLVGDVPVQIGLPWLLGLGIGAFLLIKKKLDRFYKRLLCWCLLIFFFCLFFMQPVSAPLWQRFSILRSFQFPWRLLSPLGLGLSLSAVSFFYVLPLKKNRFFFALLIISLGSTVYYWRPLLGYDRVDEQYYWRYPLNSTYFGEANTIWAGNPPDAYPSTRLDIIDGEGEIKDPLFKQTVHQYQIVAASEINILDRTLFYPGWKVYRGGREIPVQFQDPEYRGLITFRLPAGEHQISVHFEKTKDRLFAELISLVSAAIWLTILVRPQKFPYLFKTTIEKFRIVARVTQAK